LLQRSLLLLPHVESSTVVLLSALLQFLLEKQTQCCFLRLLWSLESNDPIPHLRAGILRQQSTTPTTMMTIYEIRHSRSRGKTATYAWKYGIRATTVFYTHESTRTVQAKPRHTLINTVFARPPNSTLMSLRIQCKRNRDIRLEIRYSARPMYSTIVSRRKHSERNAYRLQSERIWYLRQYNSRISYIYNSMNVF
jgi:hypothetical protein